jgi:hypothetical protein
VNMSENAVASHKEVLELLSEHAREGSISAAIALERALRATQAQEREEVSEVLERIIDNAAGSTSHRPPARALRPPVLGSWPAG